MSATFDATTKAAYDAATTAPERSAIIVAALTGTISVKVFDADDTEMGSGTMVAPWATAAGSTVTVGEVSAFTAGTSGTPDSDWYIRFQNSDASRWVRGSFGLASSSQDFTWSLSSWTAGQPGTIGTATITTTGNSAPVFTVAPTAVSIAATGGTIQFTAEDPEGSTVTYSMPVRTGFYINPTTGLVTVTSAADGTSGSITVTASDGDLSTSTTCDVTVGSGVLIRWAPGHYFRPGYTDTIAAVVEKITTTYDSRIKGIAFARYWSLVETSKGTMYWDDLDAVFNACVSAGKKFMFRLQNRRFNSVSTTSVCPQYLINESLTYVTTDLDDTGAAIWRQAAMDYQIDVVKRVIDRYGDSTTFVGILGEETALGVVSTLPSDYTAQGLMDQEIRYMQALRAYAPQLSYYSLPNYLSGSGTSAAMASYYAALRALDGVYTCGGPDLLLYDPPPCLSQRYILGTDGGVNHIGTYGSVTSVESKDFNDALASGVSYVAAAAALHAYGQDTFAANMMTWTSSSPGFSAVYDYIATHPTTQTVPTALDGKVLVL